MNTALASNPLVAQPIGPPTDISWEAWDTSFRASAIPKTSFARPSGRALGWGYLLAEATPPLPASQFIGNNAWQRRIGAIRTIVYSGHDDPGFLERMRGAGAWGCVSKREEPDTILRAVREVAAGRT